MREAERRERNEAMEEACEQGKTMFAREKKKTSNRIVRKAIKLWRRGHRRCPGNDGEHLCLFLSTPQIGKQSTLPLHKLLLYCTGEILAL